MAAIDEWRYLSHCFVRHGRKQMLLPDMKGKPFGPLNLNDLYREHIRTEAILGRTGRTRNHISEFLDAALVDRAIYGEEGVHNKYGWSWSYGDYLRSRRDVWAGSYLDRERKYLHLGLDVNAPAGTIVACDVPGVVIHVDDDHPEEHGWGPRVFVHMNDQPFILIFAHLDKRMYVRKGSRIKRGQKIGMIGAFPHNGGWYEHLHVQVIQQGYWTTFLQDPSSLDGYAPYDDKDFWMNLCPDPLRFIQLS